MQLCDALLMCSSLYRFRTAFHLRKYSWLKWGSSILLMHSITTNISYPGLWLRPGSARNSTDEPLAYLVTVSKTTLVGMLCRALWCEYYIMGRSRRGDSRNQVRAKRQVIHSCMSWSASSQLWRCEVVYVLEQWYVNHPAIYQFYRLALIHQSPS